MRALTVFAVVVVAASACVSDAPPPVTTKKPFHVEHGQIVDEDGRVVVLRGVNLSGFHKNAPYLDFHQPADFRLVHDELGMNALRFLIEWAAVEPQPGAYNDAYLDDVRERMSWAHDAGLLVVLDMHQDVFGEGFLGGNGAPPWACEQARYDAYEPQELWFLGYLDENVVACFDAFWDTHSPRGEELQTHYAKAWAHVAEKLGDHPAIIGFEPMNEPWVGSYSFTDFEPRALQPFYERVVPAVRAVAPHWLAFLEPMSLSNLGRDSQLAPFPFDDVVYAPHSYDSNAEKGEGFDAGNRQDVLDKLQKLRREADAIGAALWIGEYGGDADAAGITEYMDAEYDAFASVFAGSAYWDFSRGDGYGIANDDGSEKSILWDVLVRPAPERVAGTMTTWAFDEASHTFTLGFTANGGTSTLRVPARFGAFVVDVEHGAAVVDADVVSVDADAGSDVVVTVR